MMTATRPQALPPWNSGPADVVLACQEADCALPWGVLSDGVLVVQTRHHGRPHTVRVRLVDLIALAQGQGHLSPPGV
jgi:hypothetical protein